MPVRFDAIKVNVSPEMCFVVILSTLMFQQWSRTIKINFYSLFRGSNNEPIILNMQYQKKFKTVKWIDKK